MNVENVLKLANFIEAGTHPWNMTRVENCFFGQAYPCFGVPLPADVLDIQGDVICKHLEIPSQLSGIEGQLCIPPIEWDTVDRAQAVRTLRHLAATGEVSFKV